MQNVDRSVTGADLSEAVPDRSRRNPRRLACRFLALTAAIALNHRLGLPSRALAQYTA